MGLKVKAIERNVSFVKDGEPVWRYVMQPDLSPRLSRKAYFTVLGGMI